MVRNKFNTLANRKWVKESLLYLLLMGLIIVSEYLNYFISWNFFLVSLSIYSVFFVHAMVHRWYLFGILVEEKKIAKYLIITVLFLLFFSVITYYTEQAFNTLSPKEIEAEIEYIKQLSATKENVSFGSEILRHVFMVLFFCSIFFMIHYFENEKNKRETKLLIHQLEIKQLREYLNPHFIFNTLNNIYGVSLEQPERVPDLLMKMSQIMRYQIESIRLDYVLLNDEIAFIENFIAIENERLSTSDAVIFNKSVIENDFVIAPALLLPFIENAYKYGTNSIENTHITVKLELDKNGLLTFEVKNSFNELVRKKTSSTGVGLENVKQRLALLYSNNHQLLIRDDNAVFHVHISLNVNFKIENS